MTTIYDVPAEACQATIAASADVRAWLRAELARKLEPLGQGGPRPMRIWMGDSRAIGLVPQSLEPKQPKAAKPCQDCRENPAVATGLCRRCYDQKRGRGLGTSGSPRHATSVLREMRGRGMTFKAIAAELGMHPSTVCERLNGRQSRERQASARLPPAVNPAPGGNAQLEVRP